MDENIVREFEAAEGADAATGQNQNKSGNQRQNQDNGGAKGMSPFTFKHLKLVERKKKMEKILTDRTPKVIMASDSSLDWGFAKDSLRQVAEGPNNLLLITEPLNKEEMPDGSDETQRMTLGRMIWQWYEERQDGVALEKTSDGAFIVDNTAFTVEVRS